MNRKSDSSDSEPIQKNLKTNASSKYLHIYLESRQSKREERV